MDQTVNSAFRMGMCFKRLKHMGLWLCLCLLSSCVFPQAPDAPFRLAYLQSDQPQELKDVVSTKDNAWTYFSSPLHLGFSKKAVWIKVSALSPQQEAYRLWVQRGNLEHVCGYFQTADSHWRKSCAGSGDDLSQLTWNAEHPFFDLPANTEVFFLEIHSNNVLLLPVRLEKLAETMYRYRSRYFYDFTALGSCLAMSIFFLGVYARLRERTYLYFGLYIFFVCLYWFGFIQGYSRLLPYGLHSWLYRYAYAQMALALILALRSFDGFFEISAQVARLRKGLRLFEGIAWIFFVLSCLSWGKWPLINYQLLMLLMPFVFGMTLYLYHKQGLKLRRTYFLVWLLIQSTGGLVILTFLGVLPYFNGLLRLMSCVFVLSYLLIALVLMEHILSLRQKHEQLLKQLLELTQSQNERLEKAVTQRTGELQSALDQLESSHRFKDRLFSILAHDLRSPFASLSSILQLSEHTQLEPAELQKVLRRLRSQIDGLQASLENLLLWSRSQLSREKQIHQTFPVQGIVDEIFHLYLPVAGQKGVELHQSCQKGLYLSADPDQIRLILRNLVNNAVKFTPAGQRVMLSARQQGQWIEVEVTDQGIGMSPSQLEKIFNRTVHHIRPGTEGEKGIGLGLELCQEYAARNGGEILVSSSLGQGSTFILQLPKAQI